MLNFLFNRHRAATKLFVEQLVDQLRKRYAPALDTTPGKRPSANRLTRIMEDTCAKAVAFQQEKSLGWLDKARLGNQFRWALSEAGYSKEFVDFATEAVIVSISRRASTQSPATPE